jgi:hypothetical protein
MVKWAHRWIAVALGALGVHLPGFRPRLRKSLDDLDREIRKVRVAHTADCSEEPLDVDALASTDELRVIIGLHLDGWSWREINGRLRKK